MHPQILDILGGDLLPVSIFKFIKMFFFAHSKIELGEFTMVSQPIRLILVDCFIFHFFEVVFHFHFFVGLLPLIFLR